MRILVLTISVKLFVLASPLLLVSVGWSQTPPSSSNILTLRVPTLEEELTKSDGEPRKGLFKMNLRFIRAKYSRPTPLAHQYLWQYFKEADVVVNFSETANGYFSPTSAEERKKKAVELLEATIREKQAEKLAEKDISIGSELGKEYKLLLNGKITFARTFAHRNIWYLLLAQPKIDKAEALIERMFSSFEFLEKAEDEK